VDDHTIHSIIQIVDASSILGGKNSKEKTTPLWLARPLLILSITFMLCRCCCRRHCPVYLPFLPEFAFQISVLKKSSPNVVRNFFYCRQWEQNNCKFLQITAYSYSFQHVNKEKGLTKQAIATQKRESEKRSPPTKPPTENFKKIPKNKTHTHTYTHISVLILNSHCLLDGRGNWKGEGEEEVHHLRREERRSEQGTPKRPCAPRLKHEDDDDVRIFLSILSLYVQVNHIQIDI
jgi:hypothetical protein